MTKITKWCVRQFFMQAAAGLVFGINFCLAISNQSPVWFLGCVASMFLTSYYFEENSKKSLKKIGYEVDCLGVPKKIDTT